MRMSKMNEVISAVLVEGKQAFANLLKVISIIQKELNWGINTPGDGNNSAIHIVALPSYKGEDAIDFAMEDFKNCMASLQEDSRSACVVPATFLNHPRTKEVRMSLVDSRLLEKVVLLAPDMSYIPQQQIAVLFLNKNAHSFVKFVDEWKWANRNIDVISALLHYDKLPTEKDLHRDGFNIFDEEIDYSFDPDFDKHTDTVNFDMISSGQYSLMPNLYIKGALPLREGFHLTDGDFFSFRDKDDYEESSILQNDGDENDAIKSALSDATLTDEERKSLEVFIKEREQDRQEQMRYKKGAVEGKVFGMEDLKEFSSYASHLDVSSIKSKSYEGIYYELRGKNVLVVPMVGKWIPTYIETQDNEVVYIPLDNMCILFEEFSYETQEPLYELEYVANEFCKDYVKKQLRYDAKGRLSFYDIDNLRVYLPNDTEQQSSLERQREIVKQERQAHIHKLEAELGINLRELHLRKHRLANLLSQLKNGFDLLNEVRQENGGQLKDTDKLAPCIEENVGQYFEQIQNSINKVAALVSHFIEEQHPKLEDVSLRLFLEKFREEYPKKMYKIDLLFEETKDKRFMVHVDKDMLRKGLENIVHNAEVHGFLDNDRKDYCVRICVSEKEKQGQQVIVLVVANNGCPMDKSVEKDRIFEWGYGSHTGLGMWELRNIIEQHFGGILKLQENPTDKDFSVEYEIQLPKV